MGQEKDQSLHWLSAAPLPATASIRRVGAKKRHAPCYDSQASASSHTRGGQQGLFVTQNWGQRSGRGHASVSVFGCRVKQHNFSSPPLVW